MKKRCPRCGSELECLHNQPEQCWCSTVSLTPELREYLASNFEGCLCRSCLEELSLLYGGGRLLSSEHITTPVQIGRLAALADEVWHEFFVSILSAEQIDYMVDLFQSSRALTVQIASGYEYYIFNSAGRNVGYTGIKAEDGRLFLSKLYVSRQFRGQGFASQALDFVIRRGRMLGCRAIWLTVNRHNLHAIDVYRHWGFETLHAEVTDIGEGFVMDDFIMELPLE